MSGQYDLFTRRTLNILALPATASQCHSGGWQPVRSLIDYYIIYGVFSHATQFMSLILWVQDWTVWVRP
jgi:hypothetical protein